MWIVCRDGLGYSNCTFDAGFVTQFVKTLMIHRGYLRRCRQPVMKLNCRYSEDPHQSLSDFHCSEVNFVRFGTYTLSLVHDAQDAIWSPSKNRINTCNSTLSANWPLSSKGWIPSPKVPSRLGRFRCKDGFLARKCLPISAYRQEQEFALARLPLQASGNDHKPQRHDSGCHRQEPSKALVNKIVSAGIESSPYDNDSLPQGNSAKTHVGVWMQRSSPQ